MGGIAQLAKALGHEVEGSDANIYPPMSTQLSLAGITLKEGYKAEHLDPPPDQVIVGNAMSRGNPAVEYVLNRGLNYISGPQWLSENLLRERWVLAVAGTHGKTTTSAMLAWILEYAGLNPGFLVGGVPENFGVSARIGSAPFFVVEADEYDTAFFDKRSKFVHYHARTLIMNNLEFDHADIFDDLAMIQRQFHHLVRTVPGEGKIIVPSADTALREVLDMGCWSPIEYTCVQSAGNGWSVTLLRADGSEFDVLYESSPVGRVSWDLIGDHNVANALSAVAAARHAGVPTAVACDALNDFRNVKRRMEYRGEACGVTVYDDFAHHPTAIEKTLRGVRASVSKGQRVVAVLEPRSNTMRMGVHADKLAESLLIADGVYVYKPEDLDWDTMSLQRQLNDKGSVLDSTKEIIAQIIADRRPGDQVIVMSNGGFESIHGRLLEALKLVE